MWQLLRLLLRPLHLWQLLQGPDSASGTVAAGGEEDTKGGWLVTYQVIGLIAIIQRDGRVLRV